MTMTYCKIIVTLASGLILLQIASSANSTENTANFFKHNDITIHIGFERGSIHDRYSRLLAHHLGRNIPGNPGVKVENSTGSSGMHLANLVYHFLPQDGTVIANVADGIAVEPLLGNKRARFDGRKFNWLGSINNEVSVCAVWHTVPVTFWQDLINRQTVMGGTGAGSESDISPKVLNNIFGTRMRLVTGFPNDGYLNFAIERGELDGRCGWAWSKLKSNNAKWLKDKKLRILLQMSMAKHPALPDIPLVLDFAKSKKDLQVLKLTYASQLWGRPYLVGPRVPKVRVTALQGAFNKTMTDKRFLEEAKRWKLQHAWVDGPTVKKAIEELYGFSNEVIAAAKTASRNRSNIQISRAVIPIKSASGRITNLQGDGRELTWAGNGGNGEIHVSGTRTKIIIDGRKAKRKALKLGMTCEFIFRASSAKRIKCQ